MFSYFPNAFLSPGWMTHEHTSSLLSSVLCCSSGTVQRHFRSKGSDMGGTAGVFCPLSANTKEAERQRRARWWKAAPQTSSAPPDDWLMFKRSGSIRSNGSSFINVIFRSRGWREWGGADFCQSLAEIHASRCDEPHSLIFHINWINVHLFPLSGAALTLCL